MSGNDNKSKERSDLVNLFLTKDDDDSFDEFVANEPEQFVIITSDIVVDPTTSKQEEALSVNLFHQLRGDHELWQKLSSTAKSSVKRKLLDAIANDNITENLKISLIAHVVAIIATLEDWEELSSTLASPNCNHDVQFAVLGHVAHWCPERLQNESMAILKAVYAETLNIDDSNIDAHATGSLFSIISRLIKDETVTDLAFKMQIFESTLSFLYKSFVDTEQLNIDLFQPKQENDIFEKMSFSIGSDSFSSSVNDCVNILFEVHRKHYQQLSFATKSALFFVLNILLEVSVYNIESSVISFSEDREDWREDEWQYAMITNTIFSIFMYEFNGGPDDQKGTDFFDRYFVETNDNFKMIRHLVQNIDYDLIHESVYGFWIHTLEKLSKKHAKYFWFKHDLIVPFLQQKHPDESLLDLCTFKIALYNQEWLAVRGFVRTHYPLLYDQLRIPIMEMVLKYFSPYVALDLVSRKTGEIFTHQLELKYDIGAQAHNIEKRNKNEKPGENKFRSVENQMLSQQKKHYLISGFVKPLYSDASLTVNSELAAGLCELINRFCPWLLEMFDRFTDDGELELQNEGTLFRLNRCEDAKFERTIYGSVTIPPTSLDFHEWKFKIISGSGFGIGIDQANCDSLDQAFVAPSETRSHYAYASWSGKFCNRDNYKPYGGKYGVGDVITMVFDAERRVLRFLKNGIRQRVLADQVVHKAFKMAVCTIIDHEDVINANSVSLLSYRCVYRARD